VARIGLWPKAVVLNEREVEVLTSVACSQTSAGPQRANSSIDRPVAALMAASVRVAAPSFVRALSVWKSTVRLVSPRILRDFVQVDRPRESPDRIPPSLAICRVIFANAGRAGLPPRLKAVAIQ
jgi:hypothetical protein